MCRVWFKQYDILATYVKGWVLECKRVNTDQRTDYCTIIEPESSSFKQEELVQN